MTQKVDKDISFIKGLAIGGALVGIFGIMGVLAVLVIMVLMATKS